MEAANPRKEWNAQVKLLLWDVARAEGYPWAMEHLSVNAKQLFEEAEKLEDKERTEDPGHF